MQAVSSCTVYRLHPRRGPLRCLAPLTGGGGRAFWRRTACPAWEPGGGHADDTCLRSSCSVTARVRSTGRPKPALPGWWAEGQPERLSLDPHGPRCLTRTLILPSEVQAVSEDGRSRSVYLHTLGACSSSLLRPNIPARGVRPAGGLGAVAGAPRAGGAPRGRLQSGSTCGPRAVLRAPYRGTER